MQSRIIMNIKKFLLIFGLATTGSVFATQYEAESATLSGNAEIVTSQAASGGKYVDQKEGDIEFKVVATTPGKYLVKIHYKAGDFKSNYIVINGESAGQVDFNEATSFTDVTTIVTLKAGENTFTIKHYWGWISVDYIDISEYVSQAFTICNAPITPNATPEAVKLYDFLVSNFGKKTISGVMTGSMDNYTVGADFKTHEDVASVFSRSGKYPALVGVDFLFATGPNASESWYKGYTEKAISIAKDLWKNGGIPAFTWHWKDPADSVDAFYATQNAAGEGNDYTTFDYTQAFMTGTTTWDTLSSAYKGIIADIDYIADYFLALQKENIAAIFRPLHEAGGNWFWWGTKKGTQFAALYRLVYERMVFIKGVKNLIWVFNPSSTGNLDWNPGESYYDVLSIDIYNEDNDHSSNASAFDDFKTKWGLTKILALSENGPIPDITKMQEDNAMWSWWMPWYGSWGGKYIGQTSNNVWKSNMENENIITLDKMPGWDKYTITNASTNECKVATATSKYNGDEAKASGNYKNYKMQVTYENLTDDGALIEFTKLPKLTESKTVTVELEVNGSGAIENGVWIGLAFVRNGISDSLWTWEQSPSDGCWLEQKSGPQTCKFDITKYLDDNKEEHPIDLDNLFSLTFVTSAPGFSGTITFDNLITDNGVVISSFDSEKDLFANASDSKIKATISMIDANGSANISAKKRLSTSQIRIQNNNINLVTTHTGLISVDVFSLNGNLVTTLYRGNLAAGNYAFSIADMPKGQYIVRIKGTGIAATQPVRIK